MFQTFFTNTIKSGFIKNLLEDSYLPKYTSVHRGDYIVKGVYYCYDCYVIYCTKTGYINPYEDEINADTPIAEYDSLDHYIFGRFTPGLTNKFISRDVYYDSRTHRQLGEYLRHFRDYYGVNLMSLYNCFDYTVIDDIYLTKGDTPYVLEENYSYKVLSVPIKFNRDYTIAIQCTNTVSLLPVIHDGRGLITTSSDTKEYLTDKVILNNPLQQLNMNFNKPHKIHVYNDDTTIQRNEKYLRLLIQLPKNNKSSVVVLEGDYTNEAVANVFDVQTILKNKPYKLNDLLVSNLSLLKSNTEDVYAFSSRLLEYLSNNVIGRLEIYDKNIERVQSALFPDSVSRDKGTWSDSLRVDIYNKYTQDDKINPIYKTDVLGYVDKDIEKYLHC